MEHALPQVPGPLAPFLTTGTVHGDIEFIEELGNPEVDADAHVWKVRINGSERCYALKIFWFKSIAALRELSSGGPLASPHLYLGYYDPFSSECRAYARLKEEGREDLAVRAHGYILLTPEQEAEVAEIVEEQEPMVDLTDPDVELDGSNAWNRYEEHRHLPVRAIVKDLQTDGTPFTASQVSQLWDDLEDLHKLGILVQDIGLGNYMNGKLIDFSRSWVMPHPALLRLDPDQRRFDPMYLRSTIVDCSLMDRWPEGELVIPDELYACSMGKGQNDRYGIDPSQYDWRKWEKDLTVSEAFIARDLFANVTTS